jgi:hypothetical protein
VESGCKAKTDKKDCKKLALLLEADMLNEVFVSSDIINTIIRRSPYYPT